MKSILLSLFLAIPALGQNPLATGSGIDWTIQSSAFYPSNLTGLVLWTTIGTGVTNGSGVTPPANNDPVQGWRDISGNNFGLTKGGGSTVQPIYKSSGGASNNSPYISFTASGGMSLTNSFGGATKAQPLLYFMVLSFGGNPGNGAQINSMSSQNPQILASGSQLQIFDNAASKTYPSGSILYMTADWIIFTCKVNGSTSTIGRTNGVAIGTTPSGNPGTLGSPGVTLGNYFNSSGSSGINIVEFLIYSGNDMSSSDMTKVEQYLANKYNIHNGVL